MLHDHPDGAQGHKLWHIIASYIRVKKSNFHGLHPTRAKWNAATYGQVYENSVVGAFG